MLIKER